MYVGVTFFGKYNSLLKKRRKAVIKDYRRKQGCIGEGKARGNRRERKEGRENREENMKGRGREKERVKDGRVGKKSS